MTDIDRFKQRRAAGGSISSADLLRACGKKLTDVGLWEEFQRRWRKAIFGFLIRALRMRSSGEDIVTLADDLAQEVYVRLVQNDGRILRSFKGNTDFEVAGFLARVCVSAVADYYRRNTTLRRGAEVIPLSAAVKLDADVGEVDLNTILSWIDVERLVEADPDRKNAARNVLMFKLHCIDGFSYSEIAQFPAFSLGVDGVQSVIQRLKARLKKRIDY